MAMKIGGQNNKIERDSYKKEADKTCDCPKTKKGVPYTCEWGGKCMIPGMIYKCTAKNQNGGAEWNYIGLTGGKIKPRISVHKSECRDIKYSKTTLSKKVINDREGGVKERVLTWEKLSCGKARGANQKLCNICDKETMFLMKRDTLNINSREEIGGYCPHRRGWLLKNIASEKIERKK